MPINRSHGKTYAEPDRHDSLTEGEPRPAQGDAGAERRPNGTLVRGARAVPRKGGQARKGTTQLSHGIDASGILGTHAKRARYFRRAACNEIATTAGGGFCGILPSALVKLAAEAMALAEAALEAGNIELHRKLGETARGHLVYARELAAKDAKARREARGPEDPLARFTDCDPSPTEDA